MCHFTWRWQSWTPPVWLRLFLFTTTSTIAVEQAFLHFYLIWSTDLFCPPVLAFTESVISFHTFAFSAFVMTFLCFDLIMVMFFSTRKPSQPRRNFNLSVFFLLNRRFLTFFYKKYYGIMGYYPLFKLLTHWLLIHSTIQRLSNVKLSSGYGTAG